MGRKVLGARSSLPATQGSDLILKSMEISDHHNSHHTSQHSSQPKDKKYSSRSSASPRNSLHLSTGVQSNTAAEGQVVSQRVLLYRGLRLKVRMGESRGDAEFLYQ